jgi:BirA family transcriptional regulator, biotin operon repressor / biotin---[acetyl-CoA-carboxylase] ligase
VTGLDGAAIERELARLGASLGRPLSVVAQTGSTNEDARHAALAGAPHGATFVADAQTTGRGRGGHRWHSPPGENLYLSVILRPRLLARNVAPIALVIGVAVASVVEHWLSLHARRDGLDLRSMDVRLKWPNDVLAGGRKLSGILVEGQLRDDGVSSLVVGVGLNVGARSFPPEIEDRATSLALLGCDELSRELLAAALLSAIGDASARFEVDQLDPFAEDLARLDWLRGRCINVGGVAGVASGIDVDGHLLIRTAEGAIRAVAAGEVSVLLG